MEKLVPQLLKKVGISLQLIRRYYLTSKLQHQDLAKEALWLATCESKDEAVVIRKASSLMIEWMKEDIRPQLAAKLRERAKNHRGPTDDAFTLPWGERVAETLINSGEQGPLSVAIEPTPTDQQVLEGDAANYLYKILQHVLEWWGPQSLAWFVLCMLNDNKYTTVMGKIGATKTNQMNLIKQAERSIKKIKLDIQTNFQTTRI